MRRPQGTRFSTLRLNHWGAAAWAVVSLSTGAIAVDADDMLLMRLTQADAERIAGEMTDVATRAAGPAEVETDSDADDKG